MGLSEMLSSSMKRVFSFEANKVILDSDVLYEGQSSWSLLITFLFHTLSNTDTQWCFHTLYYHSNNFFFESFIFDNFLQVISYYIEISHNSLLLGTIIIIIWYSRKLKLIFYLWNAVSLLSYQVLNHMLWYMESMGIHKHVVYHDFRDSKMVYLF